MSMQTDCIYGYGFAVYASDEELKNFVNNHRETIKGLGQGQEVLDYIDTTDAVSFNPKEDFYDYENETTGDTGFYGLVAEVMEKETGIRFEFRNSDPELDGDSYILLVETYPWNLNEAEKNLTQDSLESICKRYIQELNPNLTSDYQRIEYFG